MLESDGAVICDAHICQHSNAIGLEAASRALQGLENMGSAPIFAISNLSPAASLVSKTRVGYFPMTDKLFLCNLTWI